MNLWLDLFRLTYQRRIVEKLVKIHFDAGSVTCCGLQIFVLFCRDSRVYLLCGEQVSSRLGSDHAFALVLFAEFSFHERK